jgi:hypothetical protein
VASRFQQVLLALLPAMHRRRTTQVLSFAALAAQLFMGTQSSGVHH